MELIPIVYAGYVCYQERLYLTSWFLSSHSSGQHRSAAATQLWLLVDPVELGILIFKNFALLKPQANLLLCVVNAIRTVTNISSDILTRQLVQYVFTWEGISYYGIITTNSTRVRCQGVCSTKNVCRYVRVLRSEENRHHVNQHTATSLYR